MTWAGRLLSGLLGSLLLFGLGYAWGDHNRDNAWRAKHADVVRAAHAKYQAEVKRGLDAAGNYLNDLRDQESRYVELEKKSSALRARVPLLVPPAAAPGPAAAGAGSEPRVDSPATVAPCINVAARAELSLGAVRLWNSALAGDDLPAGACGAAAATADADAACAASAGIPLTDAWANHARNAQSCAEDRLRHQRLIDFLKGKTP